MNIDDRLKEAFQAKAATAKVSPEAFEIIRDRSRAGRRIRLLQIAGAGLAVPALAIAAITLADNSATRVAPTPGPAGTVSVSATDSASDLPLIVSPSPSADVTVATGTPSAGPTPTTTATPSTGRTPASVVTPSSKPSTVVVPSPAASPTPDPVPPSTSATADVSTSRYADAIAVARPGGKVDILTADGVMMETLVVAEGRAIYNLAWTPDRKQLYAASQSDGSTECSPEAVSVDLATKKVSPLGRWNDFAFSSDGKQLAALVASEGQSCQYPTLLVRDLASGDERTIPSGQTAEWDGLGELVWVPDADRVVFIQSGLGDSTVVRVADLTTTKSLAEAVEVPASFERREGGELVHSVAYLDNRLIFSLECCLGGVESTRLVEINRVDGSSKDLLELATPANVSLDASPDGTRLSFRTTVWKGDTGVSDSALWVWTGSAEPRKLSDDELTAHAW